MRASIWTGLFGLVGLVVLMAASPAAAQANPFQDWAAAVVSADWRDGQGEPIDAFDNARRDLVEAFVAAGFRRENIAEHSLRPGPDGQSPTPAVIGESIWATTQRATAGCLLYFTSHGSPRGMVFGDSAVVTPAMMDRLVDAWCGERPTVVVVSACFSGVFVPALAAPNRMVITAARRDRASFGCSEDARYPYFDGCVLEALPQAEHFPALAEAARACVARREREERLKPPSEPQVHMGGRLALVAPMLRFSRAPPATTTAP